MMNICVVAIRFRRGQAYVSLQCEDTLRKAGHRISIYSRVGRVQGKDMYENDKEFAAKEGEAVAYSSSYDIDEEAFRTFLIGNEIDCVLFIEEQYQKGLGNICRGLKIKSANIIAREFFDPCEKERYDQFDLLISPVKCGEKAMRTYDYPCRHVKWGVDQSVWGVEKRDRGKDIRRFVHCAGWGGVYGRRQTELVIDAFNGIKEKKGAKLLIHVQSVDIVDKVNKRNLTDDIIMLTGNVDRNSIVSFYQWSDVALAPSLWEGIGLSLIEPQMIGLPVITVNNPPMNEWVIEDVGGRLIDVDDKEFFGGINVLGAHGNKKHFISILESYIDMEDSELKRESERVKAHAMANFDWGSNGKELVNALETLVEEKAATL